MIDPSAKEVSEVNWSQVSASDLKNGFAADKPFPLVCPGRHCLEGVNHYMGESHCLHRALISSFTNSLDVYIDRLIGSHERRAAIMLSVSPINALITAGEVTETGASPSPIRRFITRPDVNIDFYREVSVIAICYG